VGNSIPVAGFNADLNGCYRHSSNPCMGAVEYEVETTQHDTAGRITRRTIAGHHYHYSYDAIGRLVSYIDSVDSSNNAAYKYDALGNRVEMTVGGVRTRFIYQGADVIAGLVDENNDGVIDRKRYYWNLQKIDQKGGFVDVDPDGTRHWYYYLTDQVGSVLAVIDSDGNIVNQYDYDAFGNLIEENSFEQVPNRYRFHGREYDEHRGDYYYRLRTYIPEWGMFTGPDRDIRLTDPNGACNYLFCNNNPLVYVDPWGLFVETIIDVGSIGWSLHDMVDNPSVKNAAFLTWDVGATLIPFVPGSYLAKGGKIARRAVRKGAKITGKAGRKGLQGARNAGRRVGKAFRRGDDVAPMKLIPEFSNSTINDVVSSSARGRSAQITEGARGIAKKQGHATRQGIQSAFEGVKPTQANADAIIRDVLQNPADRFIGDKVIDVYNAAGQGVRFEKGTGRFIGFLEGTLKSQ